MAISKVQRLNSKLMQRICFPSLLVATALPVYLPCRVNTNVRTNNIQHTNIQTYKHMAMGGLAVIANLQG